MADLTDLTPSNPQTASRVRLRGAWCLGMLLLLFTMMMGKLVYIHIDASLSGASAVSIKMESTRGEDLRRGSIVDSRGRDLAVSVRSYGCSIDPTRSTELEYTLSALSGVLSMKPNEIEEILKNVEGKKAEGKVTRFVWVKKELRGEEVELLRTLNLPGVMITPTWRRFYPQGRTACHLVGFTDRESRGLEGVEAIADSALTSVPGGITVLRDATRQMIVPADMKESTGKSALDVVMTIDSTIQVIAERELAKACEIFSPKAALAMVMNPYNGDILAMTAYPSFDANKARETKAATRLNPAISAVFEPGSVFKPFIVAAALDAKKVQMDSQYFCENGAWNLGFRVLHDTHPYGMLSLSGVVEKSSNIGIAKVAAFLGPDGLYTTLRAFGFAEKTGINLYGELPGLLIPRKKWNVKFTMTSIPMGHEIAVTPLQLMTAYSVIANGGILVRPRLIHGYRTAEGHWEKEFPVEVVRRVIQADTALTLREMMGRVVTDGTGKQASCEEYPIGGKTGTTKLAGLGGYTTNRYISSFCGFAPVTTPRLVVMVTVNEPIGAYYGGTVSAPVVKEILRQSLLYLAVPPAGHVNRVAMNSKH